MFAIIESKNLFKDIPENLSDALIDPLVMQTGDYISIQAHLKHRVDWTDTDKDMVWLTIHY